MRLPDEFYDMVWDASVERVSQILNDEPNMTPEKHARIMKEVRAIHDK